MSDTVVLAMPRESYDTLRETLEMDAESSAFDADLRGEIAAALETVREVPQKVHIAACVFNGILDELHVHTTEEAATEALLLYLVTSSELTADLTAEEWWRMKEEERAPQDVEDSSLYQADLVIA